MAPILVASPRSRGFPNVCHSAHHGGPRLFASVAARAPRRRPAIREVKDTTTIRSVGQCRSDLLDMSSVVATTACYVLPEAQSLVASPERAAKALEILG